MLIGGWGQKSKKIADAGLLTCKHCHNTSLFELRELSKALSLYFVPIAKWNKKTYLVCSICDMGYELSENDTRKLLQEVVTLPDNNTLSEIWNKMDLLFTKFMNENKNLEGWSDFVKGVLSKWHKADDITYVLSCYNQGLLDSLDKK